MNSGAISIASSAAVLLGAHLPVRGTPPQDEPPAVPAPIANDATSLPDYTGDWTTRQYLSGDWGGQRTKLAEQGLTLDFSWTQFAQGVLDGGRRRDWDYGGNFNTLLNADLGQLGLVTGGAFSMCVESKY